MQESFDLALRTTNIETFCSRLALAQQKAIKLLQADKAGCKFIRQMGVIPACNSVLTNIQNAKLAFLDNFYTKETSVALALKTPSGRDGRLNSFLSVLQEYEPYFMDIPREYQNTIQKAQLLLDQTNTD